MFDYFIQFIQQSTKKYLIVCLHDFNLVSILASLGDIPDKDPLYLASIMAEISDDNNVTVYYDAN